MKKKKKKSKRKAAVVKFSMRVALSAAFESIHIEGGVELPTTDSSSEALKAKWDEAKALVEDKLSDALREHVPTLKNLIEIKDEIEGQRREAKGKRK